MPGRFFFNNVQQQLIHQRLKIFLHLFPMDTAVDIQDKRFVFLDCRKDLQKSLLPGVISLFLIQRTPCILQARPFHKIVNIFEVIVKSHAVDAAVLCDVPDGDFGQRLFQQQIFQ